MSWSRKRGRWFTFGGKSFYKFLGKYTRGGGGLSKKGKRENIQVGKKKEGKQRSVFGGCTGVMPKLRGGKREPVGGKKGNWLQ